MSGEFTHGFQHVAEVSGIFLVILRVFHVWSHVACSTNRVSFRSIPFGTACVSTIQPSIDYQKTELIQPPD